MSIDTAVIHKMRGSEAARCPYCTELKKPPVHKGNTETKPFTLPLGRGKDATKYVALASSEVSSLGGYSVVYKYCCTQLVYIIYPESNPEGRF